MPFIRGIGYKYKQKLVESAYSKRRDEAPSRVCPGGIKRGRALWESIGNQLSLCDVRCEETSPEDFPVPMDPGCPILALFAKGGIPRISIPTVAYPTLCKEREGWGTRPFVVLSAVPNTNSPKDASRPRGVSRAERWQVERSGIPHLAQSARSDMGHPGSIYAGEIRRKVFSHLRGDFADLTYGVI